MTRELGRGAAGPQTRSRALGDKLNDVVRLLSEKDRCITESFCSLDFRLNIIMTGALSMFKVASPQHLETTNKIKYFVRGRGVISIHFV